MEDLFNRYKDVCKNSTDKIGDANVRKWKRFIALHEKSMERNSDKRKQEMRAEISKLASKRRYNVASDIPKNTSSKIINVVDLLLEKHPEIESIYISGSYANGRHLDINSSKKFKKLMKAVYGKVESDFDFVTHPKITEYNFDGKNDLLIVSREKILIWTKEDGYKF